MKRADDEPGRSKGPPRPFGFLLPREQGSARWLPILIGTLVVASTTVLAERQHRSDRRALDEATDSALREVRGAIDLHVKSQLAALARLQSRWQGEEGITHDEFMRHAGALVRDFAHIRSIAWVDRDYVISWTVSAPGFKDMAGARLGRTESERLAYDQARERDGPSMSPPIELLSGDRGFVIVYPLFVDAQFDGFLLGTYLGDVVLSSMLSHVATRYGIDIAGETGPLWTRPGPDTEARYARTGTLDLRNQQWRITLTPRDEVVATYMTPQPALMIAGSVLVAGLLAAALRGAWLGRIRNQHLRQANSRLAREVTRRTQAEAAEKSTREELSSVVNSLPAYVWSALAQADGLLKTRYESKYIEAITGRPAGSFSERDAWVGLVHPDDRERVAKAFRDLVSGEVDEDSSEYRFMHSDGELRFIRQHVRVTDTAEGRRLDGVALDFTDLRRAEMERAELEARMHEAQRLESLGGLAGGIAHDFNNLLVAMLGHATLARKDLVPGAPAERSLASIERAARRAADLCRQMLAYAGMGTITEERIDLREVVEEMRDLLRASIPRTIAIESELSPEPAGVEADPSQLRQVVLNLITNASEAIGEGPGRIDVTVGHVDVDDAMRTAHLLGERIEPGPHVLLRVRDDGCGMDDETRRRIFEPFFSTKFRGRGLGLAAVLGIVRRCGGALRIESAPGAGTTISVLLRPVELSERSGVSATARVGEPIEDGHVLVVEDDDAAREFAITVLERAGLRVSQATDGVEGVEVFRKHAHEIRCVVLDLTMPRMDGVETAKRMRRIDPGIAIVLSSGYPEDDAMKRFGRMGIIGFLQKPYEPERLVEAVFDAVRERDEGHAAEADPDASGDTAC